ncbi:NTP transferase domain-containing protein [Patescibacteria group bacterium]
MKFRIVILAAGKGTRMKQDFPKALTPVAGQPILKYLIESILATELDSKPIIVTGPEGTRLCDDFGVDCEYVIQKEQLGTAHALHVSKDTVGDADGVIVLYGDHPFISADSLTQLSDRHSYGDNTITMMTALVPSFNDWYCAFSHWGRILRGKEGHIRGIKEFKDASDDERKIKEVNPSLFCFDTKWLWENIDKIGNKNAQGEYYLTDLVALAVEQGRRISSLNIAPEEAIGINTPDECQVAEGIYEKILKERNA